MSKSAADLFHPGQCQVCKSRDRSLFTSLSDGELTNLSYSKTCTSYRKGQALFHRGTRPLGVFCINSGSIKVSRTGVDGKDQILKISASGDLLGYKALIAENHYEDTAEALEDCSVCFIPKDDFLTMLSAGSQFYMDILKAICIEHNVISSKITQMAQRSVRQRLALTLLMLHDTYGLEHDVAGKIEINLTREDLSNIVGTATESLIRLLNQFKQEEMIRINGRKIELLDTAALALAAER